MLYAQSNCSQLLLVIDVDNGSKLLSLQEIGTCEHMHLVTDKKHTYILDTAIS